MEQLEIVKILCKLKGWQPPLKRGVSWITVDDQTNIYSIKLTNNEVFIKRLSTKSFLIERFGYKSENGFEPIFFCEQP